MRFWKRAAQAPAHPLSVAIAIVLLPLAVFSGLVWAINPQRNLLDQRIVGRSEGGYYAVWRIGFSSFGAWFEYDKVFVTMPADTIIPSPKPERLELMGFGISRDWNVHRFDRDASGIRREDFAATMLSVWVPHWFLMLLLLIQPMIVGMRAYRRACKLAAIGRCSHCGYDLRATPLRCPECGKLPRD